MWHEARRREKATQKLFNDHKKRAEKRREENRIDPNSFLQINGLKSKLCLDPGVYKQATKSLVAWQGDSSVTIDRFDVRATLSSIPTTTDSVVDLNKDKSRVLSKLKDKSSTSLARNSTVLDADETGTMKKLLDYERYRLLIQNDFNKISDESRLKLVAKSDFCSDAKMRKLRNNRFGTSGESSMANNNNYGNNISNNNQLVGNSKMQSNNNNNNNKDYSSSSSSSSSRKQLGSTYNSVPPPSSLMMNFNNKNQSITTDLNNDNFEDDSMRGSSKRIVDLDDYDNLDLDNVDHILGHDDTKRINDVTKRYGFSSDEFTILAKRDNQSEANVNELLKELNRCLKKQKDEANKMQQNSSQDVYGPALPPELANTIVVKQDSPSSSDGGSPVRQRSPSGAIIPLRSDNDHVKINEKEDNNVSFNDTSTSSTSLKLKRELENHEENQQNLSKNSHPGGDCKSKVVVEIDSLAKPIKNPSSNQTTVIPISSERKADKQFEKIVTIESRNEGASKPEKPSSSSAAARPEKYEPRRASTPLAYKRNCRSERSVSRERRSSRSHKRGSSSSHNHRDQRHKRQRSSRSTSTTSSCSSSNSASPSSHSSSSNSSSGKRRRKRGRAHSSSRSSRHRRRRRRHGR